MEFNDQILIVRATYNKLRMEYYTENFRKKLFIASHHNPEWYNTQNELLKSIMANVENSILRGNPSRSIKYLALMKCQIKKITDQTERDVVKILNDALLN